MQEKYIPIPTLTIEDADRFWAKVDMSQGADSCWPWTGKARSGYGRFKVRGRWFNANRIAISLSGDPIDPSRIACHTCDNPACCNPRHLYSGTDADNARDMIERNRDKCLTRAEGKARGRQHQMYTNPEKHRLYGERNWNTKLDPEKVRAIRRLLADGQTPQEVANKFGMSRGAIRKIADGKTWVHVK